MTKQQLIEQRTEQLLEQGWQEQFAKAEAEKLYSDLPDEPAVDHTKTKPAKRNK